MPDTCLESWWHISTGISGQDLGTPDWTFDEAQGPQQQKGILRLESAIPWYIYLLAILAGTFAGIINTLAGSGSIVTLPMLVMLGLPADVANGTNRIGVISQNVVAIITLRRSGKFENAWSPWLTIPAVLGAMVGARVVVQLNQEVMNYVIGGVMVLMLIVILMNPRRWLREHDEENCKDRTWKSAIIFFLIGAYGGFIQAGIGVFLLFAMVVGVGYSMAHANLVKLTIVLLVVLSALPVFIAYGQVNWPMGLLMSVGQAAGAWIASRFLTSYRNANLWIRRLLIVIVSIAAIKFLGGFELAQRLIGG